MSMIDSRLFSIVLAAGASRRYGSPKQLARFSGSSLVRNATRLACDISGPDTVLVVGASGQQVIEECAPFEGLIARNERFAEGIASSIACGVRSAQPESDAVLILLADQPLITREHLRALVTTWRESDRSIVATEFAGITGPPVIFPSSFHSALLKLTGDQGARAIISANEADVLRVPFADAAIDIDTPDDLRQLY